MNSFRYGTLSTISFHWSIIYPSFIHHLSIQKKRIMGLFEPGEMNSNRLSPQHAGWDFGWALGFPLWRPGMKCGWDIPQSRAGWMGRSCINVDLSIATLDLWRRYRDMCILDGFIKQLIEMRRHLLVRSSKSGWKAVMDKIRFVQKFFSRWHPILMFLLPGYPLAANSFIVFGWCPALQQHYFVCVRVKTAVACSGVGMY